MSIMKKIFGGGNYQNILDQYLALTEAGEWQRALPLIKMIVQMRPEISTSWFNYGVCLDELANYSEAARAFEQAYQLDADDFGAQYRMFRSLFLGRDDERFALHLKQECEKFPGLIQNFIEDEDFGVLFEVKEFRDIADQYS